MTGEFDPKRSDRRDFWLWKLPLGIWLWIPLLLFAFFAGLAAYMLTQPKDEFVESTMIGQSLPAFALVDLGRLRFAGRRAGVIPARPARRRTAPTGR